MSTIHGSTLRQHHYRASMKKKIKEMSHRLLHKPSYSHDIHFVGNKNHLLSHRPQEIGRITNYNDRKHIIEDDIDANVDKEAMDFINSMHKRFEVSNTMPMIRG
ncbi:hypothetical protein R6Q59_031831 [Mikania micrantha]